MPHACLWYIDSTPYVLLSHSTMPPPKEEPGEMSFEIMELTQVCLVRLHFYLRQTNKNNISLFNFFQLKGQCVLHIFTNELDVFDIWHIYVGVCLYIYTHYYAFDIKYIYTIMSLTYIYNSLWQLAYNFYISFT